MNLYTYILVLPRVYDILGRLVYIESNRVLIKSGEELPHAGGAHWWRVATCSKMALGWDYDILLLGNSSVQVC